MSKDETQHGGFPAIRARLGESKTDAALRLGEHSDVAAVEQRDYARRVALAVLDMEKAETDYSNENYKLGRNDPSYDGARCREAYTRYSAAFAALAALEREASFAPSPPPITEGSKSE